MLLTLHKSGVCLIPRGLYPLQHSTQAAVDESERVFFKLIRSIEKQSCDVKELLRVQERAAVNQAEELLEKIQRELAELRRADAELEKLSHTEDHIHFLEVWKKKISCSLHLITFKALCNISVFIVTFKNYT